MMMGDAGASGGGNTNQFIGSKISLISKSEIRYEGILYSLDLEEATISLQKVRSFGTEDRVTSRPVGPKDEVYEFIIFRGADIKGIDVLEPPPQGKEEESEPVDPAIVEVQHYQPQQPQVTQPAQQQAVVGGSIGMDNRAFGNNGFGMGGAPSNVIPQHQIPSQAMHQGFSLGVGFGNGVAEVPPQRGGVVGQAVPPQQQQVVSQHQSVRPSSPSASHGGQQDPKSPSSPDNRNSSNQRRSYAPRGRGGSNDSRGGLQQQQRGGGGGGGGQAFQQRGGGQQSQRGYYQNRYTNGDARGQGQRKFYRRGELKGNKKITFDGEFDFEKANEELQKALMKIKIADGDVEDEEEEAEQKPDDGEELDKENERKEFYQKDNFFDNISCEALERKQGKRERPDWRAERKLNAETFGLPMKPGGPRGGGSSSTYYRGGGGGGYHSHNSYYNNYGGGRGGYGYGRGGGGGGGGQYRGYRGRGGYGRGSRGNNGGGGERNLERAVAPKD